MRQRLFRFTVFLFSCLLTAVMSAQATSLSLKPTVIQTAITASAYNLQYAVDDNDEFAPDKPAKKKEEEKPKISGDSTQSKKSLTRAIAYSALIPGAGEWYVGSKTKAKFFFGAEAAIWVGFTSFLMMKSWKHDDMIRYGNSHANAQLNDNSSDAFLDLVGFYESIDEYNTLGRATDPDRAYLQDTPENHWRWESEDSRTAFRHLKNSYREANRRSQFMLGLAALNRVISIIDVVRDVHRRNSRVGTEFSNASSYNLHLSFHPTSDTQVRLTLLTPF